MDAQAKRYREGIYVPFLFQQQKGYGCWYKEGIRIPFFAFFQQQKGYGQILYPRDKGIRAREGTLPSKSYSLILRRMSLFFFFRKKNQGVSLQRRDTIFYLFLRVKEGRFTFFARGIPLLEQRRDTNS